MALSPSVTVSALTRALLYCCTLYISFFLGFRQWRSRVDRVLTLNMNIRLQLFRSTWSKARGPDLATCAGLAHGLGAKVTKGAWPMNCRKYFPTRPATRPGLHAFPACLAVLLSYDSVSSVAMR